MYQNEIEQHTVYSLLSYAADRSQYAGRHWPCSSGCQQQVPHYYSLGVQQTSGMEIHEHIEQLKLIGETLFCVNMLVGPEKTGTIKCFFFKF